jgi:glycosyltransferase involved in cell wall biosynthesis
VNQNADVSNLDIAVAHWHINSWGGAEYLITKLAEALNEATIYTVGDPEPSDPNPYGDIQFYDTTSDISGVGTSLLQAIGRAGEYALWEDVNWQQYGSPDVLITSGSTTRAVITPETTLHINYCHSPPRWLYDLYHRRKKALFGQVARPFIRYLRTRDSAIDNRVDHYFANSPVIARRLWKFYKRDSEVVYPPIELDRYENRGDNGFYLHLGRLDVEKGVEAIVEAFESLKHPIIFAGNEGDAEVLDRIRAAKNMEYVGFVSEERKYELLGTCRAVVFNGRSEDFGIVPVEANASEKPCLTRNEGFPGIFIEAGKNGYHHDGSAESIREAIQCLELSGIEINPKKFTSQFSINSFENRLYQGILSRYERFQNRF